MPLISFNLGMQMRESVLAERILISNVDVTFVDVFHDVFVPASK